MLVLPARGQGMVVMTGSDDRAALAASLIRHAGTLIGWKLPALLPDQACRRVLAH